MAFPLPAELDAPPLQGALWMSRLLLIPLALLTLGAGPPPRFTIRSIQACWGALGQKRDSLDFWADDLLQFRYVLAGARADADGVSEVQASAWLEDAQGRMVAFKLLPPVKRAFGPEGAPTA